jgi:hypothetical protein
VSTVLPIGLCLQGSFLNEPDPITDMRGAIAQMPESQYEEVITPDWGDAGDEDAVVWRNQMATPAREETLR